MYTVQVAEENVEPAVYQEDIVGYVFMFTLIGSVITAYFFWYFVARDTYPGTSTPAKTKDGLPPSGAAESTRVRTTCELGEDAQLSVDGDLGSLHAVHLGPSGSSSAAAPLGDADVRPGGRLDASRTCRSSSGMAFPTR